MSAISKQALLVDNNQSFPNNNSGEITPSDLKAFNVNVIDSTVNQTEYTTNSGSWNVSIGQLNAFTASQQPSFNALNAFTSSQLTINSGVNTFTQSTAGRLTALESETSNLEAFTSSINQILVNGVSIGTSTRFFFNGFVSASIVPNVGGAIASITVLSDPSTLSTASFNSYTASAAAAQSVYSASVATQFGIINTTTASLNTSISNLNAFTASDNTSQAALNSFTASQQLLNGTFATTGSNVFRGTQNILGNVTISGSVSLFTQGGDGFGFSGKSLNLSTSVQTGITVESPIHFYKMTKGDMYITANVGDPTSTGSMNLVVANDRNLNISASSTIVRGKFTNFLPTASSESTIDLFKLPTFLASNGTTYPYAGINLNDYASTGLDQTFAIEYSNDSFEKYSALYVGPSRTQFLIGKGSGYDYDVIELLDNNNNTSTAKVKATNIILEGPVQATGSMSTSGSLTITGSVYGNVLAVPTISSTASIDLSRANYFTLTMAGTTRINVINPQPGVTATLVINTGTAASASFSSNVRQPSGSLYAASPSGNVDIISFTAVNSSIVYAFPAQSFV